MNWFQLNFINKFEMSNKSRTLMKQILNADREIGELLEGKTSFNAIYVKYNYVQHVGSNSFTYIQSIT